MRLGGKQPTAPATLAAGRRLYEVLAGRLAELEQFQQLQVGGALIDRGPWDQLEPWQRELFRAAAEDLHRG